MPPPAGPGLHQGLAELAAALLRVDSFYDSLGGLAGYQLTCLELSAAAAAEPAQVPAAAAGERRIT